MIVSDKLSGIDPDWKVWVPITKTRNWVLNDPLLDWLDLFGTANGFQLDSDQGSFIDEADFSQFVMEKGVLFEDSVLRMLDARFRAAGFSGIDLPSDEVVSSRRDESVHRTMSAMHAGTAAIAQATLWNWESETYGAVDLLVRSDCLHVMCENIPPFDASISAPELALPFHYVAVEIKFRNFSLNSNSEADNTAASHKVQLCLYNEALGLMQGFRPPMAYFIGRGWEKGSGENHIKVRNCLHALIPVTFPLQPQHGKKPPIDWASVGIEAVAWIRRVRADGSTWNAIPPTIPELRPNMKNRKDAPWHKAKSEIAEAIGEPTKIWQIGLDGRNQLVAAGHGDCSSSGFDISLVAGSSKDRDSRIRAMVSINRDSSETEFLPTVITWNREEWATPQALEFFVDFETTSNLDDDFSKLPEQGGQPLIFMIGCGHFIPVNSKDFQSGTDWILDPLRREWHFKVFYTPDLSEESEREIILDWYRYMQSISAQIEHSPQSPQVFHWSPAETRTYSMGADSAFERHLRPMGWPDINWYDFLARVVKPSKTADAFFVRGAWGFGLKSVAKSLFKLGHIQTNWQDGPADGLAAMSGSWTCYRNSREKGVPVEDVVLADKSGHEHFLFREIIDYNEVDCRTMAEAIQFIRLC